jgi:hypothetical protein
MTLYQAIERPLRASHGKEGVSGSSPDVGFLLRARSSLARRSPTVRRASPLA